MDELRNPWCFLRGLWWNLRYFRDAFWSGAWLSGHDFEELTPTDPKVQVLKCRTCGYESAADLQ